MRMIRLLYYEYLYAIELKIKAEATTKALNSMRQMKNSRKK